MEPKKSRWKALLAEYGRLAILIYLVIFATVFLAAFIGIQMGFTFDSVAADAGTLAAAWLVTKITQPFRIGATIALTPLVASLGKRLRGTKKTT